MNYDDLNREQLRILEAIAKLNENEKYYSLEECCYPAKKLNEVTGYTIKHITTIRKELQALGYMIFVRGLVCEDREGYFGSGYCLTSRGIELVQYIQYKWHCWNCGEYTTNDRPECHNCNEKRGE